jgi:hypothetical protein
MSFHNQLKEKIVSQDQALKELKTWREKNKKIVFYYKKHISLMYNTFIREIKAMNHDLHLDAWIMRSE